jgi:pimeloyl-ACP methyl ester carboxylesterase
MLAAAIATTFVVGAVGAVPLAASAAPQTSVSCADPGTKDPVLLVHGWNSDASTWRSATGPGRPFDLNSSSMSVSTFVYGGSSSVDKALSLQWVTQAGIGRQLALTIKCLAGKSATAGGIGKVLLVAHSMGGLAIRCATDERPGGCNSAGGSPVVGVADDVGLVVTFGTPNTGSFLRVNAVGSAIEDTVGHAFYAMCAVASVVNNVPSLMPGCDYLHQLSNGPASDAFNPDSQELKDLQPFNPDPSPHAARYPVREDAGQITVTTSLGTLWHGRVGDVGDMIVGTNSAQKYSVSKDGVDATTGTLKDCGSFDLSLTAEILGGPATTALLAALTSKVTCSHISETSAQVFLGDALSTINTWRNTHDPSANALAHVSRAQRLSAPVAVPGGGYEAASWMDSGAVTFWKWTPATLTWTVVGTSSYPVLPGPDAGPTRSIVGKALPGMIDAVFIANGQYSGDGTGSYIAFSNGPKGWGTLVPQPDGTLVATGNRSTDNGTPGNSYSERFDGNLLEIAAPSALPYGTNGSEWMVIKEWKWGGTQFVLNHSNIFTAQAAASPPAVDSVPVIPLNTCPANPPDGTYAAWQSYATTSFANIGRTIGQEPRQVEISMTQSAIGDGPGLGICRFDVSPYLAVTIPVGTASGSEWITAPAWLLSRGTPPDHEIWDDLQGSRLDDPNQTWWSYAFSNTDGSPYLIPPALGVVSFPQAGLGHVIVTIRGGMLTSLVISPDNGKLGP